MSLTPLEREIFAKSTAWPVREAKRILDKIGHQTPKKGYVLFETGYGPSGLPHIGTFGEVVRTSFVRFAFQMLAPEIPTKMLCVSDDIDGLRKVPDNVPQQDMVRANLGKPLTSVPDPFGTHESYGHHMNARLRAFLDRFGFEYEFLSATDAYKTGKFNHILTSVMQNYEKVMEIMLSSLREERQKTYSPFMPICPETGKVIQDGVIGINKEKNTVRYINGSGKEVEQSVLDGNAKLQWKVDFAGRWYGLEVDYEIYGKDHFMNEKIYRGLCEALGGVPPVNFYYEMFLNEVGAKISKSTGNGISVDEWLKYAPQESMSLFMFQKPQTAKRLYFDSIPKSMDEYLAFQRSYNDISGESEKELAKKFNNPLLFIHEGKIPPTEGKLSFNLLLNLASACNPESHDILWGFISKYDASLNKASCPKLDRMVENAVNYYNDFIKPNKKFTTPSHNQIASILELRGLLEAASGEDAEEFQKIVYDIGNKHGFELKEWFSCLYSSLLGQAEGPRLGSFIALYGKENFIKLIDKLG